MKILEFFVKIFKFITHLFIRTHNTVDRERDKFVKCGGRTRRFKVRTHREYDHVQFDQTQEQSTQRKED